MKLPKIFFSPQRTGSTQTETPDRTQAGFTLLELMAVLVLMGLLLGLVLPGLLRSWEREKNRATLREFTTTLRTARSEAVTRGVQGAAVSQPQDRPLSAGRINPGRRLKGSEPGPTPSLVWQNPEKSQGYIAFYGDGSTSGGKLALVLPPDAGTSWKWNP
jgi:prepilin-type N-terminal cleavage/methylation domain-containing protein